TRVARRGSEERRSADTERAADREGDGGDLEAARPPERRAETPERPRGHTPAPRARRRIARGAPGYARRAVASPAPAALPSPRSSCVRSGRIHARTCVGP